MHYFRILLHVSSLRLYADITSIRHRVHHARADLRTCAGISQPDESIQSRAILKILDMFFERNRQRRLQTIHYYAILKIVDIEVLISQTQLALIYPALKKDGFLDIRSEKFFSTVRNPYPLFQKSGFLR